MDREKGMPNGEPVNKASSSAVWVFGSIHHLKLGPVEQGQLWQRNYRQRFRVQARRRCLLGPLSIGGLG
jgi:hypothetical protein